MVSPGNQSPRRVQASLEEPPDRLGRGRWRGRDTANEVTSSPHDGAAAQRRGGTTVGTHALDLPLQLQMALEWARTDIITLSIITTIELCILLAGLAHGTISAGGIAGTCVALTLNCSASALAAWQPRSYAASWRLPLMMATRLANMILYPSAVDLLGIMDVGGSSKQSAAAAAAAAHDSVHDGLHQTATMVRSAAILVIPVAGVHACLLVALHLQLPPLAHVAVQATSVAALMRRAPAGEPRLLCSPVRACFAAPWHLHAVGFVTCCRQ